MDQKNPIRTYHGTEDTTIFPQISKKEEHTKLIGNNATVCAWFFKFMVDAFVKHVLGVDSDHEGLFGETEGYYGTVEEQGRLTLHLHTMLWIKGSLTPQQIRDRLTSKDGTFQKSLIEYLNGCHNGEFLEGVQAEVENRVLPLLNKDPKIGRKEVKDPIINVPKSPSDDCKLHKDPEWRTAALSVRTLSNGLVTSNS